MLVNLNRIYATLRRWKLERNYGISFVLSFTDLIFEPRCFSKKARENWVATVCLGNGAEELILHSECRKSSCGSFTPDAGDTSIIQADGDKQVPW